jgi:hypothetical protein
VNRVRNSLVALLTALFVLVLPAYAAAADGVGTAGRVDDAFFAILVTVLSLIQGRLDAKKDQRRHDLDRFNS